MDRINKITITNYRAFFNEEGEEKKYQINLPNGENLLVYGENGSGKSSLFKAMQDFFHSAEIESITPQENVFTKGHLDLPGTLINVGYTNDSEFEFNQYNSTAFEHAFFKKTKSSFLTYRDILKTYFLDTDDNKNNPDLFDLFVNEILLKLADDDEISDIHEKIKNLEIQVNTFHEAYQNEIKQIQDKDEQNEIFQILKGNIDTSKNELNNKLTKIFNRLLRVVNIYLRKSFNLNFSVYLKNKNSIISTRVSKRSARIKKSLYLKIKLFDSEIKENSYQSFLNEARLSALALSVYLAALRIENRRVPNQNHKFLFLDDIFIGLDISNRIPLLDILKEDFKDFQIFITTYDRHWFEVAKNWFEKKSPFPWKSFELYTDDYTYSDKEVPKLLPYKDALAQAIAYYKKSDYSASGNYLRKACEIVLTKILPPICLKDTNGNDLNNLSQLIERASYFFRMIDKSTDDLDLLAVYLQALMNPLSHYDYKASIFKRELKDVEKAINSLLNVDLTGYSFKLLLNKGTMVKLTFQVDNETHNAYEIKIKDDLWIYKRPNNATINLSSVACRNVNLYEIKNGTKGQEYHHPLENDSLKDFYENMVNYENQEKNLNIPVIPNYKSLYKYEKADKSWDDLQNILQF